jgi:uncharacterized Ntn-hydrolase superfamily protein
MLTRVAAASVTLAAAVCAAPAPAAATYSIAAVDRATGQVGGAAASCIGSQSVRIIYGVAPGVGVVHAQALVNNGGRDQAVSLLTDAVEPATIIELITAADFDSLAEQRQYGVVSLDGLAAGFTGKDNGDFAGDRQGEDGTFFVSVQGNILTGVDVIDRAAEAFGGDGCDLADRLMLALEAGAENGEGDSRCTGRGVPADSGFIEVDLPGQAPGSYLRLEVIGTGNDSPVVLLREQYDAWRADNPCPSAAPDAAPEQAPDAGSPDAGSAGGSDAAPAGGAGDTTDDGGCGGCGASERGSKDWRFRVLLLALALAAVRRGLR